MVIGGTSTTLRARRRIMRPIPTRTSRVRPRPPRSPKQDRSNAAASDWYFFCSLSQPFYTQNCYQSCPIYFLFHPIDLATHIQVSLRTYRGMARLGPTRARSADVPTAAQVDERCISAPWEITFGMGGYNCFIEFSCERCCFKNTARLLDSFSRIPERATKK